MTRFKFKLIDKRYGGEVGRDGGEEMEAANRTEVRKVLAREWRRDTPRAARACGFTPWRDVRIVWVQD
jgi:hypothetical protein